MNLSEEILLRIMTYHQVPPCYLNFLTCCGGLAMTGACDVGFSGFRSHISLGAEKPTKEIPSLKRSARHYQIALKLESTRFVPATADEANQNKYKTYTAAIYHQFDVVHGTALWIITNPLEKVQPEDGSKPRPENTLWRDLQRELAADEYRVADRDLAPRFCATLDIFSYLADWSIGDMEFYLQFLDETFDGAVSQLATLAPHIPDPRSNSQWANFSRPTNTSIPLTPKVRVAMRRRRSLRKIYAS